MMLLVFCSSATWPSMGIPSYASLLDRCYAARDVAALLHAHARLLKTGFSDHHLLRTKLCASYARCGRISESHLLLSFANRRPAFLYNSIIRSYVDRSHFSSALSVFQLMLSDGVAPNPASLASALRCAAALSSLRLGHILHSHVIVASLVSQDPAVRNSLVSMYSACGDLTSARKVFDEMGERKTLISYTSMISALGTHGHGKEAAHLFERMVEEGERPDAKAVTAVLAACARERLVGEGKRVFEMMMRRRRLGDVRMSVEHYTCTVELLGAVGLVDEAEMVMKEMDGEPDEAMFAALLKACQMHERLDVAERAWGWLLKAYEVHGSFDVVEKVAEKAFRDRKVER